MFSSDQLPQHNQNLVHDNDAIREALPCNFNKYQYRYMFQKKKALLTGFIISFLISETAKKSTTIILI